MQHLKTNYVSKHMKYLVSGRKVTIVSAEIEVEALTREEAVAKFVQQNPNLRPEHVGELIDGEDGEMEEGENSWTIIGFYEDDGSPIFEGDDYCHDEEGIMWHRDENGSCGCDEDQSDE